MTTLIFVQILFGLVGLVVLSLVVLLYRGRSVSRSVPRAQRASEVVVAAAQRLHPGEAPPQGVLTTPEKSRQVSQRFEEAEGKVRRGARVLTMRGD